MMKHITVAAAIVTLLGATVAAATTAPPQTPARPGQHLAQRLRDGVKSGQLTRAELQAIRTRLSALRAHAKELRGSGTLSPADRRVLKGEWRRLSRQVFGLKHNGIKRGGRT